MKIKHSFRKLVFYVLILSFFPIAGFSNEAEEFFPKVEGWELEVGDKIYEPANLWDLINGAADAYLSYDFKKLYTAEYTNKEQQKVKVYAFKHSNPVNTFGIYSQERNPDYKFLNIGAQGFKSPGALYFINGPYYIQLSTNDKPLYDNLEPLARKIAISMNMKDGLPAELDLLPEEGKIKNSERYISTDFLGYSFMHSAFTADYENNGEKFQIFLLAPGNEEKTNSMLTEFLNKQEYPDENRGENPLKIEAKYIGSILFYKKDKYLYGIKKADKATEEKYLNIIMKKN